MTTRFFKPLTPVALSALMLVGSLSLAPVQAGSPKAPAQAKTEKPTTEAKASSKPSNAAPVSAMSVNPLDLVQSPTQYLEKTITFEGTFNRFADLGLDYKDAFRDSRDFVSLLVLRPDVPHHPIPLSELKLFFPREKSDSVADLETGDKVRISGKVFSSALDEPWVDVNQIEILQKLKQPEEKAAKK